MDIENQQLETIEKQPQKYMRLEDVANLIGCAQSTVYKWIAQRGFPKGFRLSPRLVIYKAEEVHQWIENEIEKASLKQSLMNKD